MVAPPPSSTPTVTPPEPQSPAAADAATETDTAEGRSARQSWGRLLLGLLAFLLLPLYPQLRAVVPIDQTAILLVPAIAACSLVGWWAGGRMTLAILWVGASIYMFAAEMYTTPAATAIPPMDPAYANLARGWAMLLAGAFGLVCLFGERRPFLPRGLAAVTVTFAVALLLGIIGPMSATDITTAVAHELARGNAETLAAIQTAMSNSPDFWKNLTSGVPGMTDLPTALGRDLAALTDAGTSAYAALLALQSLASLALAWAVYHRLSRTRLGPPLSRFREMRFNDQLVWALIVGIVILVLPTLREWSGLGRNLVVFFGALYAVRGLGVLAWFMAPAAAMLAAIVMLVLLTWPVQGAALLEVAAFATLGIGLFDTWADWRTRAVAARASRP